MFDTSMPPRRRGSGLLLGALALAVVVAVVVAYLVTRGSSGAAGPGATAGSTQSAGSPTSAAPVPNVTAPANGATLNKADLAALTVVLSGPAATGASISLDGAPVATTTAAGAVTWKPVTLADGPHSLVITGSGVPGSPLTRSFTVDTTPPKLTVAAPAPLAASATGVAITGTTDPGQVVSAGDQQATAATDGTFTLTFAQAPPGVTVTATDAAGNVATADVSVVFAMPHTKAVHMTALAWTAPSLRDPVLALAKNKQITAVELDIKDEGGIVGYHSDVPLAQQAGASYRYYDARKVIAQLHGLGVRVIGRLVCFRDPTLAKWAWTHGHKDAVIQTPAGTPFLGTYQKTGFAFTNFADKLVRDYNNDLAVEAAKLGFDDILFDYVRRPDGKLSKMKIVGMSKNPSADVAEFVHQTRVALAAAHTRTYLGVSVFGIAATRPGEIAQSIPMLGKYVDYVSPMVYPSHWNPGEYGVKDPSKQPYDIVLKSLLDFQKDLKGTHAAVVPWLQDFYGYSAAQVQAQIKAARADGIVDFLLWNANVHYTGAALPKG